MILIFCCVGASIHQYRNLQHQALTSVYNKTQIYLTAASSIRSYVKDTLRPKITKTLPSDQFILEAMSTSYISRQIMNNLKQSYPEFNYRRTALNPRNLGNLADEFESGMLQWFTENPDEKQWAGMIKKQGKTFYARMMPIRAEQTCLTCHGNPLDAPRELKEMYGTTRSYGYKVGDIVGADTIYIPMDATNLLIKEKTAWVFLFGFVSLFSLFALFALLFNRTVVHQLKRLLNTFKIIYSDDPQVQHLIGTSSKDEINQIRSAFENVAANLKTAHDEVKESEAKYRTLFEASPDAIFVTDVNGKLTDLNHAGKKLFEVEDLFEFLITSHFTGLFENPEEGKSLLGVIENKSSVVNAECILKTKTDRRIVCLISANCLMSDENKLIGVEGVIRDITEEKKLNKYLAETERLASIGQLAAGVAHEINNPLGVILCYGDLILKSGDSTEQIKEDTDIITKHAHSCKTIVESLLNFARASDTMMKKADIHECLNEILSVLQNQMRNQNIQVSRELDQKIKNVVIDEDKMKQVFMNLLINSMQAMPEGGNLELMTRLCEEREQVLIDISDSGCGIPDDKLDKIFEPFFTTKERGKGTGLGLSVSYGIIQQHSGEISVISQPGNGTTFSIALPLNGNGISEPSNMRV